MKLLQMGVPKSGNYWLYNILSHIFEAAGTESGSFIKKQPVYQEARQWDLSNHLQAGIDMMDIERGKCFYRISSKVREPVEDLDEYVSSAGHVWTHSEVCENIEPVLNKFDRLVYIYRHPGDVAVSASRYAFTPYMLKYYPHGYSSFEQYLEDKLPEIIHYWMWHVTDYLLIRDRFNIHFLSYEDLLEDFRGTVRGLLQYLDIELTPGSLDEVESAVNFRRMKKKDPGHVKKGKRMQWIEVLSDQQKVLLEEMAGELMKLLNYSLRESDFLPADANRIRREDVEEVAEKLQNVNVYVPS